MPRFDIVVIGAGPGGYVAAIRAAQLGAAVAVVENDFPGGTCLNYGCIPTKTLISSGRAASMARSMEAVGVHVGEVRIDYPAMAARKDKIVGMLRKGIESLLKARGVQLFAGTGRLAGPAAVAVTEKDGGVTTLEAGKIIIATGSEPARPGIFKFDGEKVLTSREAVNLADVGKSVIIVGGGYIGCEYASLYAHLGLDVTILELLPTILANLDQDVIKEVSRGLKRRKIEARTGVKVESLAVDAADPAGVKAVLEGGEAVTADFALVAVGRAPRSGDIGLEDAGVITENGFIKVDRQCRTNLPNVYAIGDVTGRCQLAHVASQQAVVAAENAMGTRSEMDYDFIPACVFTDPEAACVGITEQEAQEDGINSRVGKFPFRALGKAQAEGHIDGLVKLIGDAETGRLLGAHIVGAGASELVAEAALAMKNNLTTEDVIKTVHAHPTLPEAFKEAAEAFEGRAIHVP